MLCYLLKAAEDFALMKRLLALAARLLNASNLLLSKESPVIGKRFAKCPSSAQYAC
jgi:hypothetical protein